MLRSKGLRFGLLLVLCAGISLEGCKAGAGVLTKEEVGAILGQPVTSVEGKNKHLTYKTNSLFIETTIEVDQRDAVGAMSTLYVRKGESVAIIQAMAVALATKLMEKL